MGDFFNGEEIIEIACQIERNGARFYRRAAEIVTQKESQVLLLDLAAMEDDHERSFDGMRADWATIDELLGPSGGDALLYLQAIASGHVFDLDEDPLVRLEKEIGIEEVLRIAIGMEKNSIVFYEGVKQVVPENLGRDKVEMILREEMRHVSMLSQNLRLVTPND